MTIYEFRLIIEGVILGIILIWCIQGYISGVRAKRERKELVQRMNEWRQEKYNKTIE